MTGEYPPFQADQDPQRRRGQLMELRALCWVVAGPRAHAAVRAIEGALWRPDSDDALCQAEEAINAIPPKPRRQILATFARLRRPVAEAPKSQRGLSKSRQVLKSSEGQEARRPGQQEAK